MTATAAQLAVVTGASTGIGLELARLCAQQRWDPSSEPIWRTPGSVAARKLMHLMLPRPAWMP
jgi:hypothetical protein